MNAGQFWNAVDKSGGDSACWPIKHVRGVYFDKLGRAWVHVDGVKPKNISAARSAYYFMYGKMPETSKKYVCHTCDNPPCCNPNHLFVGSPYDNMRDMTEKGRAALKNRRVYRELTDTDVRSIREFADRNKSYNVSDLAMVFNASKWTIQDIVFGRYRRDAGGPIRKTYGARARGCSQ